MKEIFANALPYIKRNLHKIFLAILLLIIVDFMQIIIPKIIQKTIDGIGTDGFVKTDLLKAGAVILLITIFMTIIRYFWRILLIGTAWIIDRNIRQDYYNHLLTLSSNFFNKIKTGDLMAYATNDMNAVRMLIGFGFVIGVDIIVLAIASLIFMVKINPQLTLLAVLPMPFLTIIIIVFGRKIHRRFGEVQKTFSALSGQVQESISGIRVVKAFAQEDAELDKISKSAYDYVEQNLKLVKIDGIFHPSISLIIGLSMIMVMVFGGEATLLGKISMGEFIAFFQYLGMFIWPMIAIGWVVNLYQRGTASLKRLNTIFDEVPEIIDEKTVDNSIKKLVGKINFRNLHFSYQKDSVPIFQDISFEINEGETLAIIGRTGCGKSTIIDLLSRVYNPPKNTIFIDDNEIYNIPLKILRDSIVMIPQEIFLFSDTITGNINLGKPNASKEEIISASKNAQVHQDILGFENGYDTLVGERGVTLSGGQKQRIAIARALLTNPQILILDDALSAVDTKTEKNILDHLIEMRKNKTTIIIAHRISSLQHADKIIVLDEKQIIEEGTHSELLNFGGLYKDLYDKQQLEEKLKGE
ncbi:MAG: ABC transporter ATP-binding protein [Candidatus Cloacimonetes bacterium]|jgi:ATP-binding cassette, subfamily B, multidrug efflux pump|nr:ABC transporter ATP-binding protein [Candidatus Cloacimonadota bacterium]MBT6994671.1 ABC transporter ATP-binding protein [Candidatus Cloacimonadota bacterium]